MSIMYEFSMEVNKKLSPLQAFKPFTKFGGNGRSVNTS